MDCEVLVYNSNSKESFWIKGVITGYCCSGEPQENFERIDVKTDVGIYYGCHPNCVKVQHEEKIIEPEIIDNYGTCQLLLSPDGNFDYYLSEKGFIIFKAKKNSGCKNGYFSSIKYFRNWVNNYSSDRFKGCLTADGIKVLLCKENNVFEMKIF